MEHRMAGPVGCGAGSLRNTLAEMGGHTTERALVDAALLGPRERHAVMLQLDDRGGCLLAHELDRVLVSEPVGPLHGVVHVPAPVVFAHVAQRSADAALGSDRMAARWKQFGNTSRRQARFREA